MAKKTMTISVEESLLNDLAKLEGVNKSSLMEGLLSEYINKLKTEGKAEVPNLRGSHNLVLRWSCEQGWIVENANPQPYSLSASLNVGELEPEYKQSVAHVSFDECTPTELDFLAKNTDLDAVVDGDREDLIIYR